MPKRERPSITPKKDVKNTAATQEELIQKLKKEETPKTVEKKKKIRFTMDLPVELHERIKKKSTRQGQIMKGYFVSLALKDLEEEQ